MKHLAQKLNNVQNTNAGMDIKMVKYKFEKLFTKTFQEHQKDSVPIREAACLRVQFPAILEPIPEDLYIVGGAKYHPIGFSPKDAEDFGYYCRTKELEQLRKEETDPEERKELELLLEFWRENQSRYKTRKAYPKEVKKRLASDDLNDIYPAYPLYRMTGCIIDYDKLLQLGIPGIKKEISEYAKQENNPLYGAMLEALEILKDSLQFYADQCEEKKAYVSKERASQLQEMRENLIFLKNNAPETFHQAAQLAWLYSILAHTLDYGRMDVYLGDFLERDQKKPIFRRAVLS
ncbi:MAG TPA: hypothetical protein DEG06_11335 [Lachnospiraceae bacterium]|jgi:pyruvate-formate lyase|nr:hypothetical protein [Lachnospiraceae bacterium]HBY72823.1 hypothetical protein [Lachnospiraceae bacterium]HCA69398.1 hypothetical protein [Lachnospiraceae bacterium]HCM13897.1 hypothetical protein [Lachnospiraceae bacterium]HCR41637.1 hypothetical protein [Lachnospiraceae bacterium]